MKDLIVCLECPESDIVKIVFDEISPAPSIKEQMRDFLPSVSVAIRGGATFNILDGKIRDVEYASGTKADFVDKDYYYNYKDSCFYHIDRVML